MKFGSVCSGIEVASVAWEPLGWTCAWVSEIEPFPSAVLAHRFPQVPNLGDMTTIGEDVNERFGGIDVLVGGTPCQAFSTAGLRRGLDDPRGNLTLGFCRLLDVLRPRWFVWENVPGVLSATSDGAPDPVPPPPPVDVERDGQEVDTQDEHEGDELHAFLSLLAAVQDLGYGCAWRVLDAQYTGVPQRRRRVFLVGHSGGSDGPPRAVLFERESLLWHPPASQGEGPHVGALTRNGVGASGADDNQAQAGHLIECATGTITHPLMAKYDSGEDGCGRGTPIVPAIMSSGQANAELGEGISPALTCLHEAPIAFQGVDWPPRVIPTLDALMGRNRGMDDQHAKMGYGQFVPAEMPLPFDTTQITSGANRSNPKPGDLCHPLAAQAHPPAIAIRHASVDAGGEGLTEMVPTLTTAGGAVHDGAWDTVVRRLTPRECERLQGFPDDWTLVPWNGKPADEAPDTHRYKALGNSMAVPVMRWLGGRIQLVDDILTTHQEAAS